jgi:hypothetical protein
MCTFNGDREVKVCDVALGPIKAALGAGLGGEAVRYTHLEGEGTLVELTPSEVDVRVFEHLVREGMAEAERAGH